MYLLFPSLLSFYLINCEKEIHSLQFVSKKMQRQIRKLMKGYRLGFWSEAIGRRCEKSEERCYVWIGNQSFTTGNFIQVVIYFYLVTSSRYIRLLYFFWPSSDPGLCTSIEERFLKFYWRNILDNSKNSLFLFHIFGVRRPLKALEPRGSDPNFTGSRLVFWI